MLTNHLKLCTVVVPGSSQNCYLILGRNYTRHIPWRMLTMAGGSQSATCNEEVVRSPKPRLLVCLSCFTLNEPLTLPRVTGLPSRLSRSIYDFIYHIGRIQTLCLLLTPCIIADCSRVTPALGHSARFFHVLPANTPREIRTSITISEVSITTNQSMVGSPGFLLVETRSCHGIFG